MRPRSRARHLAAVLAIIAGAVLPIALAPAAPAQAREAAASNVGIRLVDVPTKAAADPRARVYVIDHVAPGTVIERRIQVSNDSTRSSDVSVYPAAAAIRSGAFAGAAGNTQNELSSWMSVDPPALTLGRDEHSMVAVSIAVPADAPAGERYGVVWAQVTDDPGDGGVVRVSRVGVRIYLSVGPGGSPRSDFTVTAVTAARDGNGDPMVEATVRNTGARALDLAATLKLRGGPGGLSAGPFSTAAGTTLGLREATVLRIKLGPELPKGPWDARVAVTSGLERRTADATLTFPAVRGHAPVAPVVVEGVTTLAYLLAALLIMLLTAAHTARALAARRRLA